MNNVLVVLVNYNSPGDTYRCLESLKDSSVQTQVVVVDNASSGAGKIEPDAAINCHPATEVIFNPNNDGFGGGNNIGIQWALHHTQADYFFILNNDTVVLPDTLQKLVVYMGKHAEVGMCSPAILHFKTPDVYWFGGGYIDWGKGGARSPNMNRNVQESVQIPDNTFITGCAMFIRREVLENAGIFCADYFMYCEDVDYCERVLRAGYQIGYAENAKILHDAHASLVKDRTAYMPPFSWQNKSADFFVKHYVYGALLNLEKYAHGSQRIFGTLHVLKRCMYWSLNYLLHARFDCLKAMFTGFVCYRQGQRPS